MKCYLCNQAIESHTAINWHHAPTLKSAGGTTTQPTHESCHKQHHSDMWAVWGKIGGQISSLDKHWAFHLKNVKDDPLYEQVRQFYLAKYAH
jgi:hypothetical protein